MNVVITETFFTQKEFDSLKSFLKECSNGRISKNSIIFHTSADVGDIFSLIHPFHFDKSKMSDCVCNLKHSCLFLSKEKTKKMVKEGSLCFEPFNGNVFVGKS